MHPDALPLNNPAMKNPISIFLFISVFFISTVIKAQEKLSSGSVANIKGPDKIGNLSLFSTLDPGLPPSGLNADRTGEYTAVLGDINGDGYDDWAIAQFMSWNYETGEYYTGAVHIYLGSPERRTSETPADLVLRGEENKTVGMDIRKGGDVNNDGYDDMLIRTYAGWALYYGGDPLDTEPDLIFQKLDIHAGNATFASYAGDVNNDGYDDIMLSVPTQIRSLDTAHVYLYYGGEVMDNVPDKIFIGEVIPPTEPISGALNFNLGQAAGDVNNDGFGDVMITSHRGAYLYLGGTDMDTDHDILFNNYLGGGIGTGPQISEAGDLNNDGYDDILLIAQIANTKTIVFFGGENMDNIPDVEIPSFADYSYYSMSFASLGDQNKDGYDDIILGISTGWSVDTGEVRIYYGGDPMDSIADKSILGPVTYQSFGRNVGGGGDFDGDGYNDFIVGNGGNSASLSKLDDAGDVSLFYGGETIKDEADAIFTGAGEGEEFGFSMANAGDINNDGYFDLLIGSPTYWDGQKMLSYKGKASIFLGGETFDKQPDIIFTTEDTGLNPFFGGKVMGMGDLNGDQYDDIYVAESSGINFFLGGNPMDTIADYVVALKDGNTFLAPVGDVNKDGYDDFLFTRPSYGTGGMAWLYLGGENPFTFNGVTYEGTTSGLMFGYKCEGAGDLNGDGYADFVISAPGTSTIASNQGAVLIYLGSDTPSNIPDLTLPGNFPEQYFGSRSIAAGKDINGDNYDDLVISDNFYSESTSSYEGRLYVYLGGESMDSIVDFTITGDSAGLQLGKYLKLIPDINGDGFDEIMCNRGYNMPGKETTSIYYGGSSLDSIIDISLDYSSTYFNFEAFIDEKGSDTYFLISDPANGSAGPSAGRVYIYSTKTHAPELNLEVSRTEITIGYETGSNGSFNIISNTSWSISTSSDWLTISPESGSNDASINITASSTNPSTTESRSAILVISGEGIQDQSVTVIQEKQLILTVAPTELILGYESGSSANFNITSNTSWTITNTSDWLSISPENGSNDATIAVQTTSANPSETQSRSAILSVSGTGAGDQSINVVQTIYPSGVNNPVYSMGHNNSPNPFRESTLITYQLDQAGLVEVKIYDVLGKEVTTLISEFQEPGVHQLRFEPSGLNSGIFIYRIKTSQKFAVGMMLQE